MSLDPVLASWLDGESVALTAPFTAPAVVAGWATSRGSDVVLVVGSEIEAVLVGAGAGLGVLVRATPRAVRDRWYSRPSGRRGALVTSIDSLHSPVLRDELGREAAGVPWAVLAADRLADAHPAGCGRGAWVEARHAACRGGGLLRVHRDGRDAPPETVVVPASPGAIRCVDRGDALVTLFATHGGGVVLRRPARSLERTLGEAGVGVRNHRLDRLRVRDWEIAEAALRSPATGVDALRGARGAGWPAAGRWTALSEPPGGVADLAVPKGSGWVVEASARVPAVIAEATAAEVDEARAALAASPSGGGGFCVSGGTVDDVLLADLTAVGVLAGLRPTLLVAAVADQRRFRPPFTDREDAYRELQAAYASAAAGWSLAERAELALTDRAPRDLRALGVALGRSAADISDVLGAMNHDSVVTVRLEASGTGRDWEASPGALWDAPAEAVATAVADLRGRRRERAADIEAVLQDGAGDCRAVLLAARVGAAADPCGGCDRCDATDARAYALDAARPVRASRAPTPRRARAVGGARRVSPGDLFSGLAGGGASKPRDDDSVAGRVRRAMAEPLPGPLRELVEELGASTVLVQAVFRRRHQGLARDVPEELVPDALHALRAERSPAGLPAALPSGTEARRGPRKRLELHRSEGLYRGLQSLVLAESPRLDDAIEAVAAADPTGPVAELRASGAASRRWGVWVEQLRRATTEALNATPGVPDLATVLPAVPDGDPAPGWSDLFALVALAKAGAGEQAVTLAEHAVGPEIGLVRGVLRAIGGDWNGLWKAGRDQLRGRATPPTVVARLELRSLLALAETPSLTADELLSWLDRTRGDVQVSPDSLGPVVDGLRGGRRGSWDRLADALRDHAALRLRLARRALAQGTLGRVLAGELAVALVASDADDRAEALADLLEAAVPTPDPPVADAAWTALPGASAELIDAVTAVLATRDGHTAKALVDAAERRRARLQARVAQRDRLRAAGAQGRLQAFGATLAKVLAPPDGSPGREQLEEAVREGLEEARRDGWLAPIIKVLRAQVRRHPADPVRTAWFARALAIAGQWAEAERAFVEAADAAASPEGRRDRRLEGARAFLRGGETDRALRILRRLTVGRPDRVVAAAVVDWAAAGDIPAEGAEGLRSLLEASRSGVYAGAIRALAEL